MRPPDEASSSFFIFPWTAPSPTPHHPRRPRRGPKRHIGGPHWTARQDWRQPSALTRAKPATRRLLVAGVTRGRRRRRAPLHAQFAFHGADRVTAGTFTVLPDGGRMDLTLRRVKRPGRDAAK